MRLQRINATKRTSSYIGTVANTPQGNMIFNSLRKILRPYGKVKRYGRNPNRKALSRKYNLDHGALRQNVPIALSTRFDIYIGRTDGVNYTVNQLTGIPKALFRMPHGVLAGLAALRS